VTLVVERRGRELSFRIKRAKYEVKAVEGRMLDDGIAYIKLRVFAAGVDSALEKLLEQMSAKNQKNGGIKRRGAGHAPQPGRPARSGDPRRRSFHLRGLIVKTVGKGGKVMDEPKRTAAAPGRAFR